MMRPPTFQQDVLFANNSNNRLNYRPVFEEDEPTVHKPILNRSAYTMKDETPNTQMAQIGIYTNPYLQALPCNSVLEANGYVEGAFEKPFDTTDYNIKPLSWNNPLTIVPDRFGFSHNFKQNDELVLNSWQR